MEENPYRVRLDMLNSFGATLGSQSFDLQDSVAYLDTSEPSHLIYPVGKHIGVRDLSDNSMRFIRQQETLKDVCAIALAPNKRFLAICERHKSDNSTYLSFYDLEKNLKQLKQTVNISEMVMPIALRGQNNLNSTFDQDTSTVSDKSQGVKYATSMNFSHDGKYLAFIFTDGVDSKAAVYEWFNKSRILGQLDFAKSVLKKVSFNPKDNHQVCLSGSGHWKLWRVQENTFKAMPPFQKISQQNNYTVHEWLEEDCLLAGTQEGELFAMNNFEKSQSADSAWHTEEIQAVTSLQKFSKGFFVASERGYLAMWVRQEENSNSKGGREPYDFIRRFDPDPIKGLKITALSISPSEDSLAVATRNNNITLINVKSLGLNEEPKPQIQCINVCSGFHSGAISQIDVAVQRPILVTCSREDSTVRLWNYFTYNCELARDFFVDKDLPPLQEVSRPLLSVAIHPNGYYLAVGLVVEIRVMHILHSETKRYQVLPIKNAHKMKFSSGGHLFVAVDNKAIYVHNAYTLQRLHMIKISSAKVTDIKFADRDSGLIISQIDGFVGRWDIPSFKSQIEKNLTRGASFHSVDFVKDPALEAEDNLFLASGFLQGRQTLRVYDQTGNEKMKMDLSEGFLTQSQFLKSSNANRPKALGVASGTDKGSLIVCAYPLQEKPGMAELVPAHSQEVTKICLSANGRYLFTGGQDGTVFIFAVGEKNYAHEQRGIASDIEENKEEGKKNSIESELADVVLVHKKELEEWKSRQETLFVNLNRTRRQVEKAHEETKQEYRKKLKELEDEQDASIRELQERYDNLRKMKEKQDRENMEAFKIMEKKHLEAVENLEDHYKRKISIEEGNFLKLEQEKLEMKKYYESKIAELRQQNQTSMDKLLKEFKTNLENVKEEYEDSKKTAVTLQDIYEQKLENQEGEHETEVQDIKLKHEDDIKELQEKLKAKEQEFVQIKTEKKKMKHECENYKASMMGAKADKKQVKNNLEAKIKQIQLLEQEKQEVLDKLKKRETDLYKYKFKIKDLKKSKHVLTHRTADMRASLEPKEQQIENLKDQLLNLEKVFDKQMQEMKGYEDELSKKQSKINQLNQDLQMQRERTEEKRKTKLKFAQDVYKIVQTKDDKAYVTGVMKLNQDYVMSQAAYEELNKKQDTEALEELDKKLKHMERGIAALKVVTLKNEDRTKNDVMKRTKENTQLIQELNSIKLDVKKLEQEIRQKEEDKEKERKKFEELRDQLKELQAGRQGAFTSLLGKKKESGDEGIGMQEKGLTPFQARKINVADKERIVQLEHQLQEHNTSIALQQEQIQQLKEQLLVAKRERGLVLPEEGSVRQQLESML